jgi:hypothetical protein
LVEKKNPTVIDVSSLSMIQDSGIGPKSEYHMTISPRAVESIMSRPVTADREVQLMIHDSEEVNPEVVGDLRTRTAERES